MGFKDCYDQVIGLDYSAELFAKKKHDASNQWHAVYSHNQIMTYEWMWLFACWDKCLGGSKWLLHFSNVAIMMTPRILVWPVTQKSKGVGSHVTGSRGTAALVWGLKLYNSYPCSEQWSSHTQWEQFRLSDLSGKLFCAHGRDNWAT